MTNQTFDPVASGWTDIGCDVWIKCWTDGDGPMLGGLIYAHRTQRGEWCKGAVHFSGRGHFTPPMWDVLKDDPLTLSPSLLCRACGHHGFIREGKWVPA